MPAWQIYTYSKPNLIPKHDNSYHSNLVSHPYHIPNNNFDSQT